MCFYHWLLCGALLVVKGECYVFCVCMNYSGWWESEREWGIQLMHLNCHRVAEPVFVMFSRCVVCAPWDVPTDARSAKSHPSLPTLPHPRPISLNPPISTHNFRSPSLSSLINAAFNLRWELSNISLSVTVHCVIPLLIVVCSHARLPWYWLALAVIVCLCFLAHLSRTGIKVVLKLEVNPYTWHKLPPPCPSVSTQWNTQSRAGVLSASYRPARAGVGAESQ